MGAKKKKKSSCGIVMFIILFLVIIAVFAGFLMLKKEVAQIFGPPTPNLSGVQRIIFPIELFIKRDELNNGLRTDSPEQNFEISQGESVSMVCLRLEQEGLIADAELLRTYLVYTGLDRVLQSGQFQLSAAMSPLQISEEMLNANPSDAVVTILPGWRIEEIAANVAGSGLSISEEEFITEAYNPSATTLSYLPVQDIPSLEGFLQPGTYVFPRETGLAIVLETVLQEFSKAVDNTLIEGFARQDLSLYEGVILASIVEKEAVVDDEKPIIASVFLNRLDINMRLETDPTVQYALGYNSDTGSWWKSPLASADLGVSSPYNTYLVFGLPPTPICNPDTSSLRAVAFPAETPYLFFRAACDGSGRHNFAISFEEHKENSCD